MHPMNEITRALIDYGLDADTVEDVRLYLSSAEARYLERKDEAMSPGERVGTGLASAILDQRTIMADRPRKWYLLAADERAHGPKRKTTKRSICCHHTAVSGGFGLHSSTLADVRAGELPIPKFTRWPTDTPDPDAVDRLLALAARFRGVRSEGVPYHAITTAGGALLLHLPFEIVSWHGNGANNTAIGYAWDGHSGRDHLPVEGLRRDLTDIITIAREDGHPIDDLTCHSAYTRKPHDPGAAFVREVILPVAAATGCTVDLDRAHGTGKPLRSLLEEVTP